MKLPPLRHIAPTSVDQACELLAEEEDSKVIAGGQSLMPLMAIRLATPSTLVDLNAVPDLDAIVEAGEYLRIGSMATHQQIVESPLVRQRSPLLAELGRQIGHPAIRSRGTLGGSIAHADASAEWPLAALALGAFIEVEGIDGRRTIEADELFVGPFVTTLDTSEIITDVWVPARTRGWGVHEVARRSGDYALALAAAVLDYEDDLCVGARVVIGAAVSCAQRTPDVEEFLIGKRIDSIVAREAAALIRQHVVAISDTHGSSEYRMHILEVAVRRSIIGAASR